VMDRRVFIGSVALGTLAVPRAARTQPARKVYRIGILGFGQASDMAGPQPPSPAINAFLRGLRELGYVYGEHFVTEVRGDEGRPERLPSLAAELVRLQPDVIVAGASPLLAVLKQTTSTIPVVMAGANDAVGEKLVQSLGRPGGNFTGLSVQGVETAGKRLELLKELVPGAAPVAVLRILGDRAALLPWQAGEAAARARGWKLLLLEVRDAAEIEGAFRAAIGARAGALLVIGALTFSHRQRIAKLAARSRLPAMYGNRQYVEAGGLMSYSADILDIFRRAATFVDKILKGAKPADLPVEQPTRFELVVNLKAAKSIGLTVPQSVLSRADVVIQ
jgi:putative ABC transport system substrate-binding protein